MEEASAVWQRHGQVELGHGPRPHRPDPHLQLLNEHSSHEVHLLEAADYPGGHTHTVKFTKPSSSAKNDGEKRPSCWVDTGFIVFNTVTYPNLLRFLRLAEVPFIESDMSFAVSRDRGLFEWAGGSPAQLFAQRSNLLDLGHWRMIWDIIRFNAFSTELLAEVAQAGEELSIGDYLRQHGYSDSFRDNYLLVSSRTKCFLFKS